jgi:HNH endonuclease
MNRLPAYLRNKIKLNCKTGCWLWTGALTSKGYGSVGIPKTKKTTTAHAAVYELLVGPLPKGTQHDHLCRVRHCVNPEHLEPVTCKVNVLRGETIAARNAAKTKCKHGHSLKDAYIRPDGGGRQCRTCLRLNWKKYDKPYSQRRQPTT